MNLSVNVTPKHKDKEPKGKGQVGFYRLIHPSFAAARSQAAYRI